MKKYRATINDQGRTLFSYIKKMMNNLPLSRIERLFRKKDIKVNGKRTNNKKYIIQKGDLIEVYGVIDTLKEVEITKANMKLQIIFEDKNILIINKRVNEVVHGNKDSLDNQVLQYLKHQPTDSFTPSHIGRLDKGTSGIMTYAKNYATLRQLNENNKKIIKIYEFKSDLNQDITTTFKITHDENKMREVCGLIGKETKTKFWKEDNHQFAQIFTGRKHQIRASLSKLGFPIYGDKKYGGKDAKRIFLHCRYIQFNGLDNDLKYLNKQEFISLPEWNKNK